MGKDIHPKELPEHPLDPCPTPWGQPSMFKSSPKPASSPQFRRMSLMDLVDIKPSVTRIVGSGSGGRRPDDKLRLVSSKDSEHKDTDSLLTTP